ncbi:hypothetical protein FN846DRAFT_977294 [Sphaerosporella brunnea]|uniref:Uncharacterized protein n=1 Tax=Sphaerosporella brunnea TaxID=1250544 RepID=A0A5J5EEP7_9PEZI|nr:hypothetical protein FN846DRAFT_977294 [Sphaerosporella brunnea]
MSSENAAPTTIRSWLSWFLPPETREAILQLAYAHPYIASYATLFLLCATLPLLGLLVFLVILVATAVFWLGVALLVTASFLSVAALFAAGVWAYFFAAFLAVSWARAFVGGALGWDDEVPEQEQVGEPAEVRNGYEQEETEVLEREQELEDPPKWTGGKHNGVSTADEGVDSERERMKRDIAKSLQ